LMQQMSGVGIVDKDNGFDIGIGSRRRWLSLFGGRVMS
jgi:hypothetical protein